MKITAITGPTASGKTALAIELCERLGGEIISCDSMQIYRGMDIGTAKPSPRELERVPHHLIDIIDPDESFSCARYKTLAEAAIADISSRGKIPVLCGGTGLYLDAVLTANAFPECEAEIGQREELYKLEPNELYEMLIKADPASAEAIHKNNKKRVIRALEIYYATGISKSEWDARSRLTPPPYDAFVIVLNYNDRGLLYRRIDDRVDAMMEAGLLGEVKKLNRPRDSTAGQAIGYKELYKYLDRETTLEDAVKEIKKATRNYAKRQLTWFRRRPYAKFMNIAENDTFKDIVNNALGLLTN